MVVFKIRMFEEVRLEDVLWILGFCKFGFVYFWLVFKEINMRFFMNLLCWILWLGGKVGLSYSININLGLVNLVFKFERVCENFF